MTGSLWAVFSDVPVYILIACGLGALAVLGVICALAYWMRR